MVMASLLTIDDLETPCVLIDLDRVEKNIARGQATLSAAGLSARPHIKTHKLPRIARMQLEAGAIGITCQKLGEAEVMADAGIGDIFLPYNLIGEAKLDRAVALARRTRLSLTVDNAWVAEGLSRAFAAAELSVDVLVECETGLDRCGVRTPEAARDLAGVIAALPGLTFGGLMTYPAPAGAVRANAFLLQARDLISAAGMECARISTGGTPDLGQAELNSAATEYRPGTYVYNDLSLVASGHCTLDDCALTVLSTVVSAPVSDRRIVDAGSKSLSSDLMGLAGHGAVIGFPQVTIAGLSEEHGHVHVPAGAAAPGLGERVRIVPNHACVVSNLFDVVHLVRGKHVEAIEPVAARGRVA